MLNSESMSIEVLIDLSAQISAGKNYLMPSQAQLPSQKTAVEQIVSEFACLFEKKRACGSLVICPATMASKNSCPSTLGGQVGLSEKAMFGG
jgi:hypothetical protein